MIRSRTASLARIWRRCMAAAVVCACSSFSDAQVAGYGEAGAMGLREAAEAGRALTVMDRHAEAIAYQRRAVELATRKFGADHPKVAKFSLALASSYRLTHQLEKAWPLAVHALAIRERAFGAKHRSVTPALMLLGQIDLARWRFADAERRFELALRVREASFGAESPRVAGPLSGLGLLYLSQGRAQDSERVLQRLLRIADAASPSRKRTVARRLVAFGNGFRTQGRFAQAERLYRQALTLQETSLGPDRFVLSKTLQALAKTYLALGRLADARQVLERARTIREQIRGESHFSVGITISMLADVYRRQKLLEEAFQLALRATQLIEADLGAGHVKLITALAVLADVYRQQGNLDEARRLYRRAMAIVEAHFGGRHPAAAKLHTALAKVELAAGDPAGAKQQVMRALEMGDPRSTHPRRAHRLAILSEILALEGRWNEALATNREATEIMRRRLANAAVAEVGGAYSGSTEDERTFRRGVFIKHVRALKKAGRRDTQLAREAFEIGQLAQASEAARAVAAMAARFADDSGQFTLSVRAQQDAIARWRALDAALLEASSSLGSQRDPALEARQRDQLARLGERIAGLRRSLEAGYAEYAAIADPEPIAVEAVQDLLREDEALVSFLFARSHGYQWVIRKDRLVFRRIQGLGRQAVAEAVSRIRASLDLPGLMALTDVPAFNAAAAHALYQGLLAPVEPALKGARHLMVVLDSALQSLPLSVLVMEAPKAGRLKRGSYPETAWLARRYAVSVLPAASSLRAFRVFAAGSQASQPFVGFGDPLLEGGGGETRGLSPRAALGEVADVRSIRRLPPLPETAMELRGIAEILQAGPETVFLREAATESRIRSSDLSSFQVVAFATHGLLSGEFIDLREPALVMTPPVVATRDDDGLLTMSEIAGLKLNAGWVVLSACNTAGPDGSPGATGLSGLAQAFFFAGSRALLVSHWPVASDSAVRLTTGAFAALAAEPTIGRAEALRRSRLLLLDDRSAPHLEHPLFWAPFVVVGEGGGPSLQ